MISNQPEKSMRVWIAKNAPLFALILAVVAFLFFYKGAPPQPASDTSFVATTTGQGQSSPSTKSDLVLGERTVPEGMREYRSTAYRFSLFYPQELAVDERSEGGGASTITFQNVEKGEGFQIFIVPYAESQVSEERFRQDIPSGVRTSLTNLSIDGATAAAFYSTNATLGDTREVWFVRNGFLYEITTLKPLDAWMDAIIQTWEFD